MKRARRGDGSIYRRKYKAADGTTKVCSTWTIEFPNGKGGRVRIDTGFREYAKAQSLLRSKLAEVNAGTLLKPGADQTTLGETLGYIVADYRNRGRDQKSLADLEGRLAHLRDSSSLGGKRANEVDADSVERYKAERKGEGAANGTINRELAVLKRAFNLALRRERVGRVPYIEMLDEAPARQGFLEAGEFARVRAALPDDLRAVADLMYWTGWRVSELLSRQWKHVDTKAGWIRLEPGESKNGDGRMFPLTPELRASLELQRQRVDELQRKQDRIIPWVFVWTSSRGGRITGNPIKYFRGPWVRACEKAGVPGRLRHDCRRTAARNMARVGIHQSVAMKLMGHKTAAMYARYTIVDSTMLQEAAAKLSRAVSTS